MSKHFLFINVFLISLIIIQVSPSFLKFDKNEKYKINKSHSLSQNAQKIFQQKGSLNFNKLNELYNNISPPKLSHYNHIHITLCLNEAYHLLASVTIASILKNANSNSYIHLHIIALNNLSGKIMEKIFSLRKKINENSEIIFYEGARAEKDFEKGAKMSERGMIDYGRLLIPEVIDDTIDRVISLDIGNIIVEKDLYELYTKNITDLAHLGVIDAYSKCNMNSVFNHKFEYVNGAVLLINVQKFKEINIYKYMVKMFNYIFTQSKFFNPYSDIMNDFLPWRCNGFLPLEFNMPEFIKVKEEQRDYKIWREKCSFYYDKREEVINAEKNVVVRNYENYPVYKGKGNNFMNNEWMKYARLTGFEDEIKKKYTYRFRF